MSDTFAHTVPGGFAGAFTAAFIRGRSTMPLDVLIDEIRVLGDYFDYLATIKSRVGALVHTTQRFLNTALQLLDDRFARGEFF